MARGYVSPAAFRRALTDKLATIAQAGKWSLPQLQRQISYDRLLERLYAVDDGWVVKGATALLARDLGVRASIDVDVFRGEALEVAERELREAARSLLELAATLEEALGMMARFADPLLDGSARGVWDPSSRTWAPD